MKKKIFCLTEPIVRALEERSKSLGISEAEVVRAALHKYFFSARQTGPSDKVSEPADPKETK